MSRREWYVRRDICISDDIPDGMAPTVLIVMKVLQKHCGWKMAGKAGQLTGNSYTIYCLIRRKQIMRERMDRWQKDTEDYLYTGMACKFTTNTADGKIYVSKDMDCNTYDLWSIQEQPEGYA